MKLCNIFGRSRCNREIDHLTNEVRALKKMNGKLTQEVGSYKCSLETQLGTIQEQKAMFDYKVLEIEQEKNAFEQEVRKGEVALSLREKRYKELQVILDREREDRITKENILEKTIDVLKDELSGLHTFIATLRRDTENTSQQYDHYLNEARATIETLRTEKSELMQDLERAHDTIENLNTKLSEKIKRNKAKK